MKFTNIDSSAISEVEADNGNVTINFKGSGKSYNYTTSDSNFVTNLQNVIDNKQSVGRFINRAIKEDKTLQIVAV